MKMTKMKALRQRLFFNPAIRREAGRIVRFGITGTICSAVHYGVYLLFLRLTNSNIAYTLGYGVGLVCNYVLTTYFTFNKQPSRRNASGFAASHVINYLMEIGLLNLFLYLSVGDRLAPLLVMVVAVPLNFLMLRFVYLHRRRREG